MKNWKTTLVGFIVAIGNVALPLIQDGKTDAKTILISCGIAGLALLTKDYDTTGNGSTATKK